MGRGKKHPERRQQEASFTLLPRKKGHGYDPEITRDQGQFARPYSLATSELVDKEEHLQTI